ncbi:MAG: phage DNA encapsidation protein [Clostridia bacterium]|nr:phage DNA encapsidation protein [Lachnospiraceae bacterium]MBR4954334.1 phage DNA encapsidation protein [Clostridia bacterium]
MKFYSLDNILKKKAIYNIIIGERSNGKTTACLRYALQRHMKDGSQCAIIRRYREDFKRKRGAVLWNTLVSNGLGKNEVKEITKGKYDGIQYFSDRWYLTKYDEEHDKPVLAPEPFAYAFAISEAEHEKSTSFNKICVIIFDEMLTRDNYLPNEFILFTSLVSTIVRQRGPDAGIKIFMLGNTVNMYAPYFSEMGLKHIQKMQQGTIDLYKYGDTGLTVAVEYCESTQKSGGKKSDVFFAFDNDRLKMVTTGIWELPAYPHNDIKYKPKDIKFIYFIIWENNLLQCEIIQQGSNVFTFIHRKTTDLKDTDRDIIFDKDYHQQLNYLRNIAKPATKLGRKLWWFFQSDNVYYQDNEVGELVNNYLKWCASDTITTV